MNKGMTWLIVGLVVGLALGGIIGYIITNNFQRLDFMGRGNFQINDETRASIISFFESNSDINEITSYCDENKSYCMYYCMEINPNHEICSQIQMPANRSIRR